MNNFSIAPWKTSIAFDRTYIRNIKNAQGEIIAQIPDWEDGLTETTANARLMAAAPELLAELTNLYLVASEQFDQSATHDGLQNCEWLARARDAIAKATGDQTIPA
jgi:hypothetical protein